MILLGLLLTGVAVGAMVGAFDDETEEASVPGEIIEGTETDDTLTGTGLTDLLSGEGGNDDLTGLDGNDILLGGSGDDLLKGRAGDDDLAGGNGNDSLKGDAGDDFILGGAGDDTIRGGTGNDTISGADIANRDYTVEDFLFENGDPNLPPVIYQPTAEAEANELFGEDGDDLLLLGANDVGTGGDGNDTFDIGEWVSEQDGVAAITDYTEGEDTIVLRYDANMPQPPTVTIQEIDGEWNIFADGELVALVEGTGSLTASDIQFLAVAS